MSAALRVSDELAAWVQRTSARVGLDEIAAAFEAGEIETRPAAPRASNRLQRRRGLSLARRRPQRSPDRQASYDRRHRLAWSGPLPGYLAARFTIADMAVLRIVADTHTAKGHCDASLDEIAARAGVCRKTAQRALRRAQDEMLIEIEERPVRGRKNLTNLVRIVSREWLSWLEKRPRAIGGQTCRTTDTTEQDKGKNKTTAAVETPQEVWRGRLDGLHPTVFGLPATNKRACDGRLS